MNATFLEEARFARHLLAFAKDPSKLDHVRKLGDVAAGLKDQSATEQLLRYALSDPGYRALDEAGYDPPLPDVRMLAHMPEGSLGRAYASHMIDNELSTDFVGRNAAKDPQLQFLSDRVLRTHDIVHVLTGHGTGKIGELAVQAFCIGQLPSGIHVAILIAGLIHVLRSDHEAIEPMFDTIVDAYGRGKRADFVLGFPWEHNWHVPLAELRRRFEIVPVEAPSSGVDGGRQGMSRALDARVAA